MTAELQAGLSSQDTNPATLRREITLPLLVFYGLGSGPIDFVLNI
jgi:hypothetical protein